MALAEGCFQLLYCTFTEKFEWHMMTITHGLLTSYFIITTRVYSVRMQHSPEEGKKILFPAVWQKAIFLLRALTDNINHKSPTWCLRHQNPEQKYSPQNVPSWYSLIFTVSPRFLKPLFVKSEDPFFREYLFPMNLHNLVSYLYHVNWW